VADATIAERGSVGDASAGGTCHRHPVPFHLVREWTVPMDRDELWRAISATGSYREWWSWLDRFDAVPIEPGAHTEAVITAPLPYDLRLRLAVTEVEEPVLVRVAITGDLSGHASLHLDDGIDGKTPGTSVRLVCDAQPLTPALRALDRMAHPLLVWGHRVVADRALAAFVDAHQPPGVPQRPGPRRAVVDTLAAAAVAGTISGLPSTLVALARRQPVLDSTRAAGTLVGRRGVLPGAAVHATISAGWTAVLLRMLPRRHSVAIGAAAGLGIGLVDLGVIGRRLPAIRNLRLGPQLADHVVFGAAVGAMARLLRDRR
jgi:hypothetical protein